ncbi:hypothetical protein BDW71DRAFT_204567 [Aspergillus fruticulosus]
MLSGASKVTDVYVGASVAIPLVAVSTGLRLWAELSQHRNQLALDDFLMVWTTLVTVCLCAIALALIPYGYGRSMETVPEEDVKTVMKVLYIFLHGCSFASASTKLSVLALYHRVFPSTGFRRLNWLTAGIVVMWLIGMTVSWGLQCRPIRKFWDPNLVGTCNSFRAESYAQGATNLALDLWVFILPGPLIARMRLPRHKKLLLGCLFSVGLATCAISASRIALSVISSPENFTLNGVPFNILSIWEFTGVIMCANLPIIYKPIAAEIRRAAGITKSSADRSNGGGSSPEVRSWYRLQRVDWMKKTPSGILTQNSYAQQTSYPEPMDVGGILEGGPGDG